MMIVFSSFNIAFYVNLIQAEFLMTFQNKLRWNRNFVSCKKNTTGVEKTGFQRILNQPRPS